LELEEYARSLLPLCFPLERDAHLLPGFELYREMVRARLLAMARVAFRRSFALLGEPTGSASFARYLAATPPRTPIIRELMGEFATHLVRDGLALAQAPAHAADLVRFEAAKWRVASASESPLAPALGEVDFEGELMLNDSLELLPLEYSVAATNEDEAGRHDPHTLLVYRRRGEDGVHWYRAPRLLAQLFAWVRSEPLPLPLAELVRRLVAERVAERVVERVAERVVEREVERDPPPDEAQLLLEELASGLTVAVERGVVLGSRPLPGLTK